MTKYRVTVPYIDDMGTVSPFTAIETPMESARANALWHINRMRDHDNLPYLSRLPAGTKLERIED